MAFSFWNIFRRGETRTERVTLDCRDLTVEPGLELQLREVAFWGCVNLIANALGKCEMRVFRNRKAVEDAETYLWNVQPNKNQNASAFWHKLVAKLYAEDEALIVPEPYGDGVVVADDFSVDEDKPVTVYKSIRIGKRTVERMNERDVMYLRINHRNMGPLIRKMGDSFLRLMRTAMDSYQFAGGQHWKVHVDSVLTADDEWRTTFSDIMNKQISPFLSSRSAVLPEMDGYKFEQISGGDPAQVSSKEIRELFQEIWNETGRAMLIPAALTGGNQQDTTAANKQFLSDVIDPLARLIEQEANRKRFTREEYLAGTRLRFDTSAILHFDIFANAANVEKIIGSGILSVNELRARIGDAPVPEEWADRHFMTKNIGGAEAEGGESK